MGYVVSLDFLLKKTDYPRMQSWRINLLGN